MLELTVFGFFILSNSLMGFSVVARNYKDKANIIFGYLIVCVILWSILNYMSNNGSHLSKLIGNHGSFTAGLAVTVMFWYFSQYFPIRQPAPRWQKLVLLLSPIAFAVTSTPLLVRSFTDLDVQGVTNIQPGVAYLPFLAYIVIVFILSAWNLRLSSKKATAELRQKVVIVYLGMGIAFMWTFLLSGLLPYFADSWATSKYGILSLTFLIGSIFYSITKHHLFDLRATVIRSMTFITIQILLMLTYVSTITLVSVAFLHRNFNMSDLLFTGGVAAFISLTLPMIIRYFRKLTEKMFFTSSYNSEVVINSLSRELVGAYELKQLSLTALRILNGAVQAKSAVLVAQEHVEAVEGTQFCIGENYVLPRDLFQKLLKDGKESYVANNAEDTNPLKREMIRERLSFVVRLKSHGHVLGYICFREKLSGRLFSEQDMRLVMTASNEIALAIENSLRYEEISEFNETLKQKVERATHELRRTNDKLTALDEAKDEFISMASHQLRTPLTSVKGYISMVLDGDAGPLNEQQHKLLEQSFISSQRMVYLISDLLNLSRLRTGKFIIDSVPTNLPAIIEEEVSQLQETAAARGLKIFYDKPKDYPQLMLDETKIRQVIMNFLDNAIYYTPAGGKITVNLSATTQAVRLEITDTGLGVPRGEHHHLFTKFYRASNAKRARPDGTGLGLFMAKKVIIAQGGAVVFTSEEGKGSTFGFSFPLGKLISPETAIKPNAKNAVQAVAK